jgi:hypothetical protein
VEVVVTNIAMSEVTIPTNWSTTFGTKIYPYTTCRILFEKNDALGDQILTPSLLLELATPEQLEQLTHQAFKN